MTEGKMRKIITAIAAAATLLFVILLSVLIYQWITIGVQNKRMAEKEESISYWTQQNKDAKDDLEWYLSDNYKTWAAFEKGYVLPKNGD